MNGWHISWHTASLFFIENKQLNSLNIPAHNRAEQLQIREMVGQAARLIKELVQGLSNYYTYRSVIGSLNGYVLQYFSILWMLIYCDVELGYLALVLVTLATYGQWATPWGIQFPKQEYELDFTLYTMRMTVVCVCVCVCVLFLIVNITKQTLVFTSVFPSSDVHLLLLQACHYRQAPGEFLRLRPLQRRLLWIQRNYTSLV